ncbi:chemokine-like protein TAFA-5a isoform X2 [Acanthopagrus latus]|uniref:chemokine-like protein TAFA-5a isoform X2 n=1 Tax=Acanthopagrus latus TaxID=8177 RepID=UPI00187CEAAF|nr:chemokine-like protein TAFA-5a isoform X2 [Acanthopagrus latus]
MQLVADGGAKPDRSRNAADSIQWNLGDKHFPHELKYVWSSLPLITPKKCFLKRNSQVQTRVVLVHRGRILLASVKPISSSSTSRGAVSRQRLPRDRVQIPASAFVKDTDRRNEPTVLTVGRTQRRSSIVASSFIRMYSRDTSLTV